MRKGVSNHEGTSRCKSKATQHTATLVVRDASPACASEAPHHEGGYGAPSPHGKILPDTSTFEFRNPRSDATPS